MDSKTREEAFAMAGSLTEEMNILEEVSEISRADLAIFTATPIFTLVCCK